jgi:hypothetical protein
MGGSLGQVRPLIGKISCNIKSSLRILRVRAEDAHLETKRSTRGRLSLNEGAEGAKTGAFPLLSGLRKGQHRRITALE